MQTAREIAEQFASDCVGDAIVDDLERAILRHMEHHMIRAASFEQDRFRDALRLLLDDVEQLVLTFGFSASARDSMVSVKVARALLLETATPPKAFAPKL